MFRIAGIISITSKSSANFSAGKILSLFKDNDGDYIDALIERVLNLYFMYFSRNSDGRHE